MQLRAPSPPDSPSSTQHLQFLAGEEVSRQSRGRTVCTAKIARAGPTSTNPINMFEAFTLQLEEEFGNLANDFSAGGISGGRRGFSGGKDVREKRKGVEEDGSGIGENTGGARSIYWGGNNQL